MIIEKYGAFDVLILQHPRHCPMYTGLAEVKVPKVCIVNDYYPRNYYYKNLFLYTNRFDLALFPERWMLIEARKRGMPPPRGRFSDWLPFWIDPDVFRPLYTAKTIDVAALFSWDGNGGYPRRAGVVSTIWSMHGRGLRYYAKLLTGKPGEKITGHNYVKFLNDSKIAVASNDKWGSVNFKHFEIPACGTLMFSDKAEDFDALGFIAGEHYVEYQEPNELPELIVQYLKNEQERVRIAINACKFIHSQHTVQQRVKRLFDLIGKIL